MAKGFESIHLCSNGAILSMKNDSLCGGMSLTFGIAWWPMVAERSQS